MLKNEKLKKIFSEVWRISWPLIIANSFWNFQVTIDRIFLGQFSTETLGASVAAVGVFWAPMALVQQTAAYVTTFVAQYFGAKKEEWIGPSVWQSIYVSVIGGFLFLLLIPLAPMIFSLMGHSPGMQALEIQYFQAIAWSALPTALIAACSGFFTGIGKSKTIMLINGVGLILNVFLDYLLIFGNFGFPSMGIVGAGYATAIANFGAALLGFYLVFTGPNARRFKMREGWRFQSDLMKRFIKFGVPSGLQWALEGLAFTGFLIFIGRLPNGDAALAASSITVSVLMLAILPVLGIAQGVSALVGQHLGEDAPSKAVQVSWAGVSMALVYICTMSVTFVLFPKFYMNWFGSPNSMELWASVQELVPNLLIFVAIFVLFDSLNLIFSFTLKGAGDTRFVSLVALVLPWPIMVFPTWYVSEWDNGVYWAWAAASVFICLQGLVFLARFLQGRWKSMRVI